MTGDRPGVLARLVSGPRIGKFLSVGAIGAAVDLAVSSGLTLTAVLPPEWAKLVGAECAILLMFLINDRWTFAAHGADGVRAALGRLVRSNVVRSVGLAVQFLVVRTLVGLDVRLVVAGGDRWPLVTLPIAIGCAVVVNYVAESLFTWRVARAV